MKNKKKKILAIETSCDETSAAIIKAESCNLKKFVKLEILSNVINSQVKLHAKYGGVYPELASREHIKNILPVVEKALSYKAISHKFTKLTAYDLRLITDFDAIAVTTGPGLIGSLLPGVNTAKTLSYVFNKPIYGVNHLEGHIYANFIGVPTIGHKAIKFPLIALIVSGGHTSLIYMKNHLDYKIIGETLDDAAGEAFDKVATLLGLGYPGGPVISALSHKVTSLKKLTSYGIRHTALKFPRPMIDSDDFNFSFSGLKTSVLYTVKKLPKPLSPKTKAQICKEFQDAVVETLVSKTIKATKKYKAKSVLLCGGVASNDNLRKMLHVTCYKLHVDFFVPEKNLCTDNAAMIGIAAAYKIALGKKPTPWYDINADSNLKL